MNQKIALYGGSFDPPHLGHIEVVEAALAKLDIDKLIILPAYQNPFKAGTHAPSNLRLRWLKKIFSNEKRVEISDFEIKKNRVVTSYESVLYFKQKYKIIYFIIGADNLKHLQKWANYDALNALLTWVVASRDDTKVPSHFIKLDVNAPMSSTLIREELLKKCLHSAVCDEIIEFYKGKR